LAVLRELPDDYLRHLGTVCGIAGLAGRPLNELIETLAKSDRPTTEEALNGLSLAQLQALAKKLGVPGTPRSKQEAIRGITAGGADATPGSSPQPPAAGRLMADDVRGHALAELRKGANPFSTAVAAVGTAAESLQTNVRDHTEPQLGDLLKIVQLYRKEGAATRVYPIVGDPGTGKTHLLYVLRTELRRQALRTGDETLFVVVEHLSPGTDPIDYLLWQVTNHMLSNKGDGERLMKSLAGRLTGRLLAEALRRLSPPQQIALVPPAGHWQRARMWFGSARLAQERIEAVAKLIAVAAEGPEPAALRRACEEAGVTPGRAWRVVAEYLDQTQSKNATDWFRKELHGRLVQFALLDDRVPFDDFHNGEVEPPAYVRDGGNVGRCLLDAWLELLGALHVPVVVVYDQLEDYLRGTTEEQEAINKRDFIKAVTSFIDKVPSVCVLAFAALGVWADLVNSHADTYARERLTQPFALAGKPAQARLEMPASVSPTVAEQIVTARIKWAFPSLDLTGLPIGFPFEPGEVAQLSGGLNFRNCILALAKRYDQIVHSTPPDPHAVAARLRARLRSLWEDQLAGAKQQHGDKLPITTTLIPEFQMALDGWLQHIHKAALPESKPWAKVEVVTKPERQQYGYLTVIRLDENKPGVGVAAWLGHKAPKLNNLVKVLDYFKDNPCPVATLVLLRADGEDAIDGMCGEAYTRARNKDKRDVRVVKYDTGFFHALMGFAGWYQAAVPEVDAAQKSGADGAAVFREFLAEVSKPLLAWTEEWRKPVPTKGT
jgi:hypothetical protein